jgi:hypothetical protein
MQYEIAEYNSTFTAGAEYIINTEEILVYDASH